MDEQFKRLEELIKDDDKIVTVTSYALIANISHEESQKLIDKYVEINKPSGSIYLTNIIKGIRKDTKKFSVMHVSGDTLVEERELYKDDHVVTIFSIQKAKHIDYNLICLTEQDADLSSNILLGAVTGKNCVKRVLRKKVLPPLPPATIKGKSSIFMRQIDSLKSQVKSQEKDDPKRDSNEESTKPKVQPQNSIASMFNKATQNKKPDQKHGIPTQSRAKQNGGAVNFLLNQSKSKFANNELGKKAVKPEKEIEEAKENPNESKSNTKLDSNVKKEKKKSDLFDSDTDEEILKDLNIQEPAAEKYKTNKSTPPLTKNKSKNSQKKKRAKADVGNDKSVKKRKRIIIEDDSESDDIFGTDKSDTEEVIEKDEETETIKTEVKPPQLPRNKRKKAVKKTYEDDEGYIVTQTEYVYETASEDENEPENKVFKKEEPTKPKLEKKIKTNSHTEISPDKPAKGKKGAKKVLSSNQPTLMNFFKRK